MQRKTCLVKDFDVMCGRVAIYSGLAPEQIQNQLS